MYKSNDSTKAGKGEGLYRGWLNYNVHQHIGEMEVARQAMFSYKKTVVTMRHSHHFVGSLFPKRQVPQGVWVRISRTWQIPIIEAKPRTSALGRLNRSLWVTGW